MSAESADLFPHLRVEPEPLAPFFKVMAGTICDESIAPAAGLSTGLRFLKDWGLSLRIITRCLMCMAFGDKSERALKENGFEKLFGTIIKGWRNRRGLSQEELAFRAKLHRTYISDIERGARNVSLRSVKKIAGALEISLATLFSPFQSHPGAEPQNLNQIKPVPPVAP